MRSLPIGAALAVLALGTATCGRALQPYCPPKGLAAGPDGRWVPDPRPVPLPDPPSADVGLPPLDPLSDLGRLSLRVLRDSERFSGSRVGEGGDTPVAVEAWRALLREPAACTAFLYLVRTGGGTPATLYGLCGLWWCDRVAFDAEIEEAIRDCGDAEVPVFFGCLRGDMPLRAVLLEIRSGHHPRAFREDSGAH